MKEFFTGIQMLSVIRPPWLIAFLHVCVEFVGILLSMCVYGVLFYFAGATDGDQAARVAFVWVLVKWAVTWVPEYIQGIKRKRALSISEQVKGDF